MATEEKRQERAVDVASEVQKELRLVLCGWRE